MSHYTDANGYGLSFINMITTLMFAQLWIFKDVWDSF